ncbi:MAG: nitroreductase family protein [Candidatus Bathyarchaeota archaeon]|nr:nitroreductase family protein [Candidatus Bathyarchaeota archaeon]
MSRRQSIRSYTSEDISSQQLLDVLWAAYGFTNERRNVPQIGYDYSLQLFTLNETASYRYIPESNLLAIHDLNVNKAALIPHYGSNNWASSAKEVLVIVWDESRMNNHYFASAETGCLIQNVHLAAVSLNLGTCVVAGIDSEVLRNILSLNSTLNPLYVMPLGHIVGQYPLAIPKYSIMNGNLPQVQISDLSLEDSLRNIVFGQEWSTESLALQELSQLLWAAYGYSSTNHRTTPSAYGIYPLIVYVSNATGVYQYLPGNHSVTETLSGDKRFEIANTFSGQVWAADAPALFLVGYDSSYNNSDTGDGGFLPHLIMETNTGCVIQQLFLEAAAWNLKANILSGGLDEWNGTGTQELRNILGLSSSIIPLYALPIGSPESVDDVPPTIGAPIQEPDTESVESNQSVTVSVEVIDEGTGVNEVILSYSTNGGQTWTDIVMIGASVNIYSGEIPFFEKGVHVRYKILAYDKADNLAKEDNAGDYYIYTVISEIPSWIILPLFLTATLFAILFKKRLIHHNLQES